MKKIKTSTKQKILLLMFSIVLTIILIEIGFGKLVMFSTQNTQNFDITKDSEVYKILTLGESTTAGTWHSWPVLLEKILNNKSTKVRFKVYNEARGAVNSVYLIGKLEENIEKYNPDMVITMMGVNDKQDSVVYSTDTKIDIVSYIKESRIYKFIKALIENNQKSKLSNKKENTTQNNSPKNYNEFVDLGWYFLEKEQDLDQAELMFKKAIENNPEKDSAYAALGVVYMQNSKLNDAEIMLLTALGINPNNDHTYSELGHLYSGQGKISKAFYEYNKSITINPNNKDSYFGLGLLYRDQKKLEDAEVMFKKAIELDPKDDDSFTQLGWIYQELGRIQDAEEMLNKAIQINPNNDRAQMTLVELDYDETFIKYKQVFGVNVKENTELTKEEITKYHYKLLYETLRKNNIKYVAMQYPTLNIEPIRAFYSEDEQKNIVFVSNEENFKDALEREKYDVIFTDKFGMDKGRSNIFRGEYGHTTEKGSRLIAENVANAIFEHLNITSN